jgi:hypothetical protein
VPKDKTDPVRLVCAFGRFYRGRKRKRAGEVRATTMSRGSPGDRDQASLPCTSPPRSPATTGSASQPRYYRLDCAIERFYRGRKRKRAGWGSGALGGGEDYLDRYRFALGGEGE